MPIQPDQFVNVDWGSLCERRFTDGRVAAVVPLTFGRARITFGHVADRWGHDDEW